MYYRAQVELQTSLEILNGAGIGHGAYVQANRVPSAAGVQHGIGLGGYVLADSSIWGCWFNCKRFKFFKCNISRTSKILIFMEWMYRE